MKPSAIAVFNSLLLILINLAVAPAASAYYDPSVQRWINRDPIGEPGFQVASANSDKPIRQRSTMLYGFAGNAPVMRYDLHGLNPVDDAERFWTKVSIPVIVTDLAIIGCICWNLEQGYARLLTTPGTMLITIDSVGAAIGIFLCNGPFAMRLLIEKPEGGETCNFSYVVICLGNDGGGGHPDA